MQCDVARLAYRDTKFFSSIVADYISGAAALQPFYQHRPDLDGMKAAIAQRKSIVTNRAVLVEALTRQYAAVPISAKQQAHIQSLLDDNTFTICTAHQPNIFTGHLYFIYKILHAVQLADTLSRELPGNRFVPVYYMGSEDADLDELGHIFINGEKYSWQTNQTGAVGRMKVDKTLLQLIDTISGQLLVQPHGAAVLELMRSCYQLGITIEQATFQLVNALFADFGLLVLLPDDAQLKRLYVPVMRRELMEGFSHKAVQETVAAFPAAYKVQASGRETNLFYLDEASRERIEATTGNGNRQWSVINTTTVWDDAAILAELETHPERFSPNVILRPVFQEMILPNIAFIGGGGEIAYWLELKKVFEAAEVPYPVLVVRNSFLLIPGKSRLLMEQLQFNIPDIFLPQQDLFNQLVKRESRLRLHLETEKVQLTQLYQQISELAEKVDVTLKQHTAALQHQAVEKLTTLEKKMLRAEKKRFEAQQRQLVKLKQQLFPNNSLQERVENFMLFYAAAGPDWLQLIYDHSLSLEQEFVVLTVKA